MSTPSGKRFFTYAVRVSEEAVVASRDRDDDVNGGDVTEQDLKDLGEMITENLGDISGYVARGATVIEVTGPTRDRGGEIPGVTGPARRIAQLNKQLEDKAEELQELRSELDGVLEQILKHAPKCWDGEESTEGIATSYVHSLEARSLDMTFRHRGECNGGC